MLCRYVTDILKMCMKKFSAEKKKKKEKQKRKEKNNNIF